MKNIINQFKNPPKENRPIPFWSWNDKLDPKVLSWQVKEMDQVGVGGFFMHCRSGIETDYLGDEWMECIDTCIQETKAGGPDSWIYDEAGWPSGFGGGKVTAMGAQFHARWLKLLKYTKDFTATDFEKVVGVYFVDTAVGKVTPVSAADIDSGKVDGENTYMVVQFCNPYYIDVMSHDAVNAFIQCTHQEYYNRFGEDFGRYVKGFFTDEPRLFWNREGDMPWSLEITDKFKAKYGYDVVEKLPLLFLNLEGCQQVRYDYWTLVSELFVTCYMKQIYDWCEAHNCQLTGHVMMEESIFTQMTGTSGVMPFYEYMHVPGIDWLRRMISSPVVPKQVGSVASQLGKKLVLTESYALCGWNVSFEELKWIAEWEFVNGVNLMCQHLQGYTLRGLRKRDYPPSLFIQQPWWKEYKAFNDYLARLGMLVTAGNPVANLLVIHPMRSGWISFDGRNNEVMKKLDADFIQISETLSGLHVDYHYGDEGILARHGSVDQNKLVVGQCQYQAVLLPSMRAIDGNTIRLLRKFAESGGTILRADEFPAFCIGGAEEDLQYVKNHTVYIGTDRNVIYTVLKKANLVTAAVTDPNGEVANIHYLQRDLGDSMLYFLVNHHQKDTYDTCVKIQETGSVKRLLAETGETVDVPFSVVDGETVLNLSFLPMQSYLLLVEKEEKVQAKVTLSEEVVITPNHQWDVTAMDLNSMTLDLCQYSIDGGEWQGPVAVIHLMDQLLNMKRSCDIALKFTFTVDMDLQKNREFWLAAETAEEFQIFVNGKTVEYKEAGWWKDTSFKKVDIKACIQTGDNEIVLQRKFFQKQKVYDVLFGENVYETEKNKLTFDVELESIYLVGDFSIVSKSGYIPGERSALFTEGPFVVTDAPQTVSSGDLVEQGFCFFAGNVELTQNIYVEEFENKRVVLELGKPDCPMTQIFVNGKLAKNLLWAPYSVDITEWVQKGENRLTVKLFGGNRNLFGPHHHVKGEVYNVGPISFTGKWSWVERETEAVVITEEDRKRNYWRDGYCFVRFGLN